MPLSVRHDPMANLLTNDRGTQRYIVQLHTPQDRPGRRTDVFDQNLHLGKAFVNSLQALVEARCLQEDVTDMGTARRLPMVTIEVTPKVAALVGDMPEVEAVVLDSGHFEHMA